MKHFLTVLLCLLLCGCAPQTHTAPAETTLETTPAVTTGLYDPEHPLEQAYPGLIRAYPLTTRKVHGICVLGSDVLTLSGQGTTRLTLLTGDQLYETASLTLDFELLQNDPSLQIHENGISFYDPLRQATIVLDRQLREIRRITVPQGLSGKPILTSDTKRLFYCTDWSVMAWDLESGIRRTVKEISHSGQQLTGLHRNGEILECMLPDDSAGRILLLSGKNGMELESVPADTQIRTTAGHYFAAVPKGFHTFLIFADTDTEPKLLLPEHSFQQQYYLEEDHAAVTVRTSGDRVLLDYYELSTGILRGSLELEQHLAPKNIRNSKDHAVYILAYDPAADCDTLYRWDVLRQSANNGSAVSYVTDYPSGDTPDTEAMAECQQYADRIADTYGISVRIGQEACQAQPWDYTFRPETLAPVLHRELRQLEQTLAQYPEGILEKTAAHFTGLTVCLVREITGTAASGSLTTATGIQFLEDNHAYVVIATGKFSRQSLYHELYHAMETHILTESIALDQWETLNPVGFLYQSDPSRPEDSDIYLQGQTRAFVDSYSMTYPKEDRARILEYAMLPDMEEVFRSEYMQRKLTAICQGIRDAYRLKKLPEILPWEQYLVTPLAPKE